MRTTGSGARSSCRPSISPKKGMRLAIDRSSDNSSATSAGSLTRRTVLKARDAVVAQDEDFVFYITPDEREEAEQPAGRRLSKYILFFLPIVHYIPR